MLFDPNSKTKKGRSFIPLSDPVMNILLVRCADRAQGWVFRLAKGHAHYQGLVPATVAVFPNLSLSYEKFVNLPPKGH